MKYKVGDKVRVKKDLVVGSYYGDCRFALGMKPFKGKILNISRLDNTNKPFGYMLQDATGFWWTDEMLEPVEEFNVGDVVYDESGERSEVIGFGVKVRTKNGIEFYRPQDMLSKTKPLQKITREELADKGYELVD